jgi:transposase
VEALLALASPAPPPVADLLADLATWIDVPADLPDLLARLPRADLYLQDEVQAALHPTLTRVWSPKGRRGQRLVEAPGLNAKVTGFGALDWRDGYFHGLTASGRRAQPLVDQLAALLVRSRARGRAAIVLYDNLRIHTPAGSLVLRAFLAAHADEVRLVYTPAYDPDANRIEWLWRVTRRVVTHAHQRTAIADLTTDLTDHFADLAAHPRAVLRHVGSPHATAPHAADPPSMSVRRAA